MLSYIEASLQKLASLMSQVVITVQFNFIVQRSGNLHI